jgi:predicted metal-dependent hydrolase
MKTEIININNQAYVVKVKIEDRNNFKASISKKSINIRAPDFLPREELFKNIEKMKAWARQKILENPDKFKKEPVKQYNDGQEIDVVGERYILKIGYLNKAGSSARMDGNIISLSISSNLNDEKKAKHISTLISRCLARKKLPEVKKRIEELNSLYFQKDIRKVFLKHSQSRLGSCSENGNINISTKLLFAPKDVFDYICIHELAHLVEQNHSDKFWALVEKAMPDYMEKEKWLKENRGLCKF